MEPKPFLVINEQPISAKESLQYLQVSGDLTHFIHRILRQYILQQELQSRTDIVVTPEEVEQAIIDFRLKHRLIEPESYQTWLGNQGINNAFFHQKTALELRLQKLMAQITEPRLQDYFTEKKPLLDLVVLSRIVVASQELATELRQKIETGAKFEQLAQEHSLTQEAVFNGMMGAIKMGTLPDPLRQSINQEQPGQLIGPIPLNDQWGVFRVEQFLPASLYNRTLKQELKTQIFEAWMAEKIGSLTVEVLGGDG